MTTTKTMTMAMTMTNNNNDMTMTDSDNDKNNNNNHNNFDYVSQVYGYVTRLGEEGCCLDGWGPKPLREAFPAEDGEEPLPASGLDTVYYR